MNTRIQLTRLSWHMLANINQTLRVVPPNAESLQINIHSLNQIVCSQCNSNRPARTDD